jgi:hypothetical protein
MATSQQVKQSLELALSLVSTLDTHRNSVEYLNELSDLTAQVATILSTALKTKSPEPKPKQSEVHPVDALLKKGKVTLSEGRYKQLVTIYNALLLMGGVTFLRAKQNNHTTWFPIDWNGNKTAALFLGAEWTIEPLSVKANGELKGDWENFDLNEFMVDFDFDQDEY